MSVLSALRVLQTPPMFLLLALVLASAPLSALSEQVETPCQCSFTSADPPGCVAYGQLGDGNLIPWAVASQECLDLYKIKDEAIDSDLLESIFPNPDGSDGSTSGFVNFLRFEDGSVASSIKAGFPRFYEESNTMAGKMEVKDAIVVDGETITCSSDMGGSQSDCFNAMKVYFASEPGASEMAGVGQQLYNAAAVSREKEQSAVRIRLCMEGGAPECGATSEMVLKKMEENKDKFCSAFGLGPEPYDYPKCFGGGSGSTSAGGDDTSPAASAKIGGAALLIFVGLSSRVVLY